MHTGDFLHFRAVLTRLGASATIGRHLQEAIEADLVLTTAVDAGGQWIGPRHRPLAANVHRRSRTNLITWPITGVMPAQLRPLATGVRLYKVDRNAELYQTNGAEFFFGDPSALAAAHERPNH